MKVRLVASAKLDVQLATAAATGSQTVLQAVTAELCTFLRKSNRKLVRAAQRHPTKLLHKWLAVNDYCDYVQQTFVAMFSDEVLKEWYAKQGSWCQGSANVVMALLVGVEAWNGVRDFMNARTRQFRHDPHAGALQTARSGGELLALLRQAHTAPFAVYVELDCWHLSLIHI